MHQTITSVSQWAAQFSRNLSVSDKADISGKPFLNSTDFS